MSWNNKYELKREIVETIIKQNVDIIILVEFCVSKGWDYFQEQLEENKYLWFMNYTSGKTEF